MHFGNALKKGNLYNWPKDENYLHHYDTFYEANLKISSFHILTSQKHISDILIFRNWFIVLPQLYFVVTALFFCQRLIFFLTAAFFHRFIFFVAALFLLVGLAFLPLYSVVTALCFCCHLSGEEHKAAKEKQRWENNKETTKSMDRVGMALLGFRRFILIGWFLCSLFGKICQLHIYKDSNWQLLSKVLQSFSIYHF